MCEIRLSGNDDDDMKSPPSHLILISRFGMRTINVNRQKAFYFYPFLFFSFFFCNLFVIVIFALLSYLHLSLDLILSHSLTNPTMVTRYQTQATAQIGHDRF